MNGNYYLPALTRRDGDRIPHHPADAREDYSGTSSMK
jgi:hypothetical protein